MSRLIALLFLAGTLHAAGPGRTGYDAQVVAWNYRCFTNNPTATGNGALNSTQSLIASSFWMGAIRNAGLYPGNILRANLMGGGMDICLNSAPVNALQGYWKYAETGSSGGLGAVSVSNNVALDTGLIPNNVSSWLNDCHIGVYMTTGGAESSVKIGGKEGANFLQMTTSYTALGQITVIGTAVGYPVNADTAGTGWYLGTRTSSAATGIQQYRNGAPTGTSSAVAGTLGITVPLYIFGQDNQGAAPDGLTVHLMAGYAIGRGITANTATNQYYQAWQQFETLLGRQK
jgi:hypothetical protein